MKRLEEFSNKYGKDLILNSNQMNSLFGGQTNEWCEESWSTGKNSDTTTVAYLDCVEKCRRTVFIDC
ncbi:MAG: hypothetical protein O9294_11825 [Cytophagales bacterium]|jgi:hypothetical protein|nr:hypothetical protein [Cytophagales bacterium]